MDAREQLGIGLLEGRLQHVDGLLDPSTLASKSQRSVLE